MKITTISRSLERLILTGMIVSDRFLREIRAIYKPEFMKPVRVIVDWCFDYYDQYKKAPSRHIQDIFNSKVYTLTEDMEIYLERLLEGLSDEYEEGNFNVEYVLDEAEKAFEEKNLRMFRDDLTDALQEKNILECNALFNSYRPVRRPSTSGLNVLGNESIIDQIYEENDRPLFRLRGALGEMINPQLVRGSLVAFMGPEKRGKSFMLDYFALRALFCRNNVVLFDSGDMSERQRSRRIISAVAGRPFKKTVNYKKREFVEEGDGQYSVRSGRRTIEIKPLGKGEALRASERVLKRARGKKLKLSVHPNSTLNVHGVVNQLHIWEHFEGFIPDVIIVDYADIMAPENSDEIFRHAENEKWKALRRLSQIYNCCVITATQSDAASYDKENIGQRNFSEDKRKYGHVTAIYALNQTVDEKEEGVLRIGELFVREAKFSVKRQVIVLQDLEIGKAYVDSKWGRLV